MEEILNHTSDMVFAVNRDWFLTYANPPAEDLFESSLDEALGKLLWDEAPELAGFFNKDLRKAMREKAPISVDGFYPPLGRWFHARVHPTPDGLTAYLLDITEGRRMVEALRANEQRLGGILENLTDGVVTILENGVIESFNPAAERIFGCSAEDITGRNVKVLMAEPDASRHDDYIKRYVSTGNAKIIGVGLREVVARRKDGSTFPAEIGISEMWCRGARIFVGVLRDISARKRAEEETAHLEARLRQSQKMEALGTLAGGVAHDLNNTLVPILGLTELTLPELPADTIARANLEKVVAAAQRGKALVNQILAFSRQDEPNRRPTELCAVIKEAFSLLRATLPRTIKISQRLNETVGPVCADATQIHQVLINLGSNAGDAMGLKGGIFEVRLEKAVVVGRPNGLQPGLPPGAYAKLTVSDTGPGMDADTLQRIFDPFFTTKPVGEGTGMGLAVAHGIIAAHGGELTVRSEPGHGTTFEIFLPLARTD
ncbi:MAG: PAS domain S-box protein [Kiloniellaceae bacterium]